MEEAVKTTIVLTQMFAVAMLLWLIIAFIKGLFEKRSFKEAFEEVVEMLKVIPFLLIYFLVIDFAIGGLFYLIGAVAGV